MFSLVEAFENSIEYVLQNEGGFVNNPHDAGGATNFGVTIATLTKYRAKPCTIDDVRNLSKTEAEAIYKKFFWDPLRLDEVPAHIATVILDVAVNQGQTSAVKLAQAALGPHVLPDGVLGSETIKALGATDPQEFIYNYVGLLQDRYADFCANAPSQVAFLKGWLRRAHRMTVLLIS